MGWPREGVWRGRATWNVSRESRSRERFMGRVELKDVFPFVQIES